MNRLGTRLRAAGTGEARDRELTAASSANPPVPAQHSCNYPREVLPRCSFINATRPNLGVRLRRHEEEILRHDPT